MATTEALDELIAYAPEISISVEESHRYYYREESPSIDYTVAVHTPECEIFRGDDLEQQVRLTKNYLDALKIERTLTGIGYRSLEAPLF